MTSRQFHLAAAAIVLAAFVIREWFVLTMTVPEPNQGDVGAYLRYALHLAWDGVFSQAEGPAVPDAFRSPGYPWLLWSVLPGDVSTWPDGRWYARIYQVQALLGAATVACVIALARQWLSRGFALLAGGWMALQAHNIAATGAILTEVLFGACLVGGLLAYALAVERRSVRLGVVAGLVLALGALTNPVLTLLPFLLAPLHWKQARQPVLVVLAIVTVALGSWSVRNMFVGADGSARAGMNFVQGSWPGYHDMAKWTWRWPAKWERLNHEVGVITGDRDAGLRLVAERMAEDPLTYARWYAYKPVLLFDWDVRIGKGNVYVINQKDTVLDRWPLLGTSTLGWFFNPWTTLLAGLGCLLALRQGGPVRTVAVTLLYLTAVHVVLQAEPRYAIAYRGMEFVLAFGALAWVVGLVRRPVVALT